MRLIAIASIIVASAAAAQNPPPGAMLPSLSPPTPQAVTALPPPNPAAPYISVGQDEPGYRSWYLSAPSRAAEVRSFNDYLAAANVAGVLPTWQLLRTATAWQDCGGQPFEVPPSSEWPHIVQTLRYVRDHVIPDVGPVEAVSVYRNPSLNQCAGGAPESAHKLDSAIDMVPLRPMTREDLMKLLCADHSKYGEAYNAGLGFYAYLRFHVDSAKFRRWNMDPAVAALCPPIVHPEDIASVGQPLPPTTPVASTAPALPSTDPNQNPQRGQPH